ncbi:MAG: DNA mismatch repair protein [Clostridiales bacterium]|nr:DNA mismatch repair protein [Clostridiales bacterium]
MSVNHSTAISLLYPDVNAGYRMMNDVTAHDLGLDLIAKKVTSDAKEQQMILRVLGKMTPDPEVARYRQDVFDDIYKLPEMRSKLLELMNQIEYLKDYGTWRKTSEEKPGLWDLMHRLDELDSYITSIESMRECLNSNDIRSKGLKDLKQYIDDLYSDSHFSEMKKDVSQIKTDASEIRSVTIGININSRFEAESLGLVSVNSKPFKKSGIVGNFADAISGKDKIRNDTEWDGDMRYEPADNPETDNALDKLDKQISTMAVIANPMISNDTLAKVPDGDGTSNSTFYLSNVASKITAHLVKKIRGVISDYTEVSIVTISKLIPELIYYIRFAEYIEQASAKKMVFSKAEISDGSTLMNAEGFYNLKLASSHETGEDIVDNDLSFGEGRMIYLLTGANRGGKTTLTQAVGLLFSLAQGGLYVPCRKLVYMPVDMIYTHFPADEDKTMDLGRLGEECVRFKELFDSATDKSLILLNESFSTTSFEEGFYIAADSVKALCHKNIRTIYNTHMHKLASELTGYDNKVSSIVMESRDGKRSFKVSEMPPEGSSYASDIAKKYGVTYEMLIKD